MVLLLRMFRAPVQTRGDTTADRRAANRRAANRRAANRRAANRRAANRRAANRRAANRRAANRRAANRINFKSVLAGDFAMSNWTNRSVRFST